MAKSFKRNGKKLAMLAVATVMAASMSTTTLFASANINDTLSTTKRYASDYASMEEVTRAGRDLNLEIAAEGFVLLKNKDNALPLAKTERKVTVLGETAGALVTGGGGSGAQERPGLKGNDIATEKACTVYDALEAVGISANPRVKARYESLPFTDYNNGGYSKVKYMNKLESQTAGAVEFAGNYYEDTSDSDLAGADGNIFAYDDAAIVVFSRSGSESSDSKTHDVAGHTDTHEHYLELNDSEKEMFAYAKAHFGKIIVIVNSPAVMELGCLEDDDAVSAVLWVGMPGWNGIMAIGGILTGTINPSGRTVDLWMREFESDPTWYNFGNYSQANYALTGEYGNNNGTVLMGVDPDYAYNNTNRRALDYAEGIYVGYKYYETVAAEMGEGGEAWYQSNVLYPFGYGLSYTSFDQEIVSVDGSLANKNGEITVKVKVTNTGSVAGKDVVQVYNGAPYTAGGIDKAAVSLVGYTKTGVIKAGKSQTVEVKFDVKELASFDYDDANNNEIFGYELEAGDYELSIRNGSHDVFDSKVINAENRLSWDGDNDSTTPNNILSQKGNAWESANTLAHNWTASGTDHYLTRDKVVAFANGIASTDAATKKAAAESLAWLLTDDNAFTEEAYNILAHVHNTGYALDGADKDTDNWLTTEKETDYKNLWTKTEADIPANWTQGTGVIGENGTYAIVLYDMLGVPYDDAKWDTFLNQLTLAEMRSVMQAGFKSEGLASIAKPRLTQSDGPGQIKAESGHGWAWVCEVVIASTWNVDLGYQMGRVVGNESMWLLGGGYYGGYYYYNGWYGPAFNTHRSPLGGRNFEYYSQDGLQGGLIGANVVKGATDMGLTVSIKHIFLNEQETNRTGTATFATEQAIREIYAKPFEMAIKLGNANGLMSAFNLVGINTSASYALNTQLFTNEWGYDGLTITDWYGNGSGWSGWQLNRGLVAPLAAMGGPTYNGTWDATARDGKGMVVYGTGDNAVASPTEWYWQRELIKRICYQQVNSAGMHNGLNIISTEVTKAPNVYASKAELAFANNSNASGNVLDNDLQAKFASAFGKYGYTITPVSGLPAGLTVSANGTLGGKVTAPAGEYNVVLGYKGNDGMGYISGNITVKVTVSAAVVAPLTTLTFVNGEDASAPLKSQTISATLNTAYAGSPAAVAPVTLTADNYVAGGAANAANNGKYVSGPVYSATGLPAGMTIDKATGVISGTPTEVGTFKNVTVTVTYEKVTSRSQWGQTSYSKSKETYSNNQITVTVTGGYQVIVNVTAPTGATQAIVLNVLDGTTLTKAELIAKVNEKLSIGTGWEVKDIAGLANDATVSEAGTYSVGAAQLTYPDLVIIDGELWIGGENTHTNVVGKPGASGVDGADGKDGLDGLDGADGVSIVEAAVNADGHLVITYSDGKVVDLGKVVGADGKDGANGANGTNGKDGKDGKDGVDAKGGCGSALSTGSVIAVCGAFALACAAVVAKRLLKKRED